ncbi:hypothetical protein J3Q64DRAFT_1716049 [Phycomyces blakesleeanus]|uniref:TFIIS-type domain-containing protein n=1 Tax=Phycomyces blakesleeanus TaxID=4837 RepID=A0ABR3BHB5_PHYBL
MSSFVIVANPGKKISLEHATHPCPRCKHQSSVQLTRSEKQIIVLNKRISDNTSVRYECSQCRWKNEELPYDTEAEVRRYLNDAEYQDVFSRPMTGQTY